MNQFLHLPKEDAYEFAWQYLIGYLLPASLNGQGLDAPQLTKVLDQMQHFAGKKSPRLKADMDMIEKLLPTYEET